MTEPDGKRGRWRLWHPFQGLWNRDLQDRLRTTLPRRAYQLMLGAVVVADTALLFGRALQRRRAKLGLGKLLSRTRVPADVPVIYFDLGTHKGGDELYLMSTKVLPRLSEQFSAYGFEASNSFYEQATARFADQDNVTMVNAAVCDELPPGGRLRLYKADAERRSASLYREQYGTYEEVDALRFSDWLRDNDIDVDHSICLLRMNIEGAEFDVIADLVKSGVAAKISGYYGMWDDVGKIDPARGQRFTAMLEGNDIDPFTFNARDLKFVLRRLCIEYDLSTSMQQALERIQRRRTGAP